MKWHGVAFLVNKKAAPLFVELSDGINFNIGLDKESSDEEKIIKQFVKILKKKERKKKKTEGTELPCQLYMRYHDKIIISTIYPNVE